jgi:hypothetical protein
MNPLRAFVGVTAILATASATRADDLADLIKRVPGDMNTVAVINVREINKSPRAIKEKWHQNHETEYMAGAIAVPAWVPVVVIGADLHPGALASGRSVALFPADVSVSSESMAKRENGVVQSTGDWNIVLSPRRGYMAVLASGIVGVSNSMPRQDFVRWVRASLKPEKPAISAFLQDTIAAHKTDHVLIATDVQDLFDPTSLRLALQQSGSVSGEAALNSLVNVLSGAKGIVFSAHIEDKTKAELRIEFAVPMDDFVGPLKKIWPKAMESSGLDIEEFKTAEARADGKSIVMTTELSDGSLRRILSLLYAPGDAVGSKDEGASKAPRDSAVLAASLRYYKAVNSALDDLRSQGGAKGKDYTKSAVFFDSAANKIEKLAILDVDPTLVQYGASVAGKMRAMAGSLRGTKMQLDAYDDYKSTTWVTSGGGWRGRWGGYAPETQLSTNVQELNTKQAELIAKLEPERAKLWGTLEGDRSAIRREMLEKYKIDFEQYKK